MTTAALSSGGTVVVTGGCSEAPSSSSWSRSSTSPITSICWPASSPAPRRSRSRSYGWFSASRLARRSVSVAASSQRSRSGPRGSLSAISTILPLTSRAATPRHRVAESTVARTVLVGLSPASVSGSGGLMLLTARLACPSRRPSASIACFARCAVHVSPSRLTRPSRRPSASIACFARCAVHVSPSRLTRSSRRPSASIACLADWRIRLNRTRFTWPISSLCSRGRVGTKRFSRPVACLSLGSRLRIRTGSRCSQRRPRG